MKYYEYNDKKELVDTLCDTPTNDVKSQLSTYTKAQLVKTYITIFECKPLSSYNKEQIAKRIVMYIHDMHRWDKLMSN